MGKWIAVFGAAVCGQANAHNTLFCPLADRGTIIGWIDDHSRLKFARMFGHAVEHILIVGVAIAILLYLLRPGVEKDEITIQPPGVDIFVVEMSDENLEVVTEGRVKSERSTVLRAEVSGVINKISKRFNNGGRIRKGEILYKIDDKELKVRKAEAEVQVAQAEIRLGKEEIESRVAR